MLKRRNRNLVSTIIDQKERASERKMNKSSRREKWTLRNCIAQERANQLHLLKSKWLYLPKSLNKAHHIDEKSKWSSHLLFKFSKKL